MSVNHSKNDLRKSRVSFRGGGLSNGPAQITPANRKALEENAKEIIRTFVRSGGPSQTLEPMSREQRKVLHEIAQRNNIDTKSHGVDPKRFMVISKRNKQLSRASYAFTEPIAPPEAVIAKIGALIAEHPFTQQDMEHFLNEKSTKLYQPKTSGTKSKTAIPPKSQCQPHMKQIKDALPASNYREVTIRAIEKCSVVIISGGTGCGKTTQVPQFILEDAHNKRQKVRILVTQPRRIAAISIAERVAKERGERTGDTVGYQVRLESKKSEKTLLTYCTTGVLLRMLTADPTASGITHVVMDEIHEREINTDYLLIALRECLKKRRDLKIILMSATIEGNMALFSSYFDKFTLKTIKMESKLFHVQVFHLDQILAMTGYQPPTDRSFFAPFSFDPNEWTEEIEEIRRETELEKLQEQKPIFQSSDPHPYDGYDTTANSYGEWVSGSYTTVEGDVIDETTMEQFMTAVRPPIRPMLLEMRPGSPGSVYLEGVRYKIDEDQSPTNLASHKAHRESISNCTLGYSLATPGTAEFPVSSQAVVSNKIGLGRLSAPHEGFGFGERYDFAERIEKKFRHEMMSILENRPVYYHPQIDEQVANTDFEKQRFGEKYEMFYGADYVTSINLHLVNTVVKYLADSPIFGSILVFLPGYDDIQEMITKIAEWQASLTNMKRVMVIPLHSQMHSVDHSDIFKPVPHDTRKIILSTNIAEASITIEDVIFVVDTGKAKEKSYDHEAKLSSLTVSPISKSSAKQRSGRAGRVTNGYCFRLYSEKEYSAMAETQLAEMKRAAIYDVTLHAKIFAPKNMRIAEFLALAPEPPVEKDIRQAMQYLEQIGAFYSKKKCTKADHFGVKLEDNNEDPEITDLGRLMARLPLDPNLSRMLLFGLALKCLTPIVNLVAMLANRDPYILTTSDTREEQNRVKTLTAQNDFSDHLVLIRLCTEYCSKNGHSDQTKFCRDNFLNSSTMRMVFGTRRQLVQELLRAKLLLIRPNRDLMTVLIDRCYNQHAESWPMVQAAVAAGCYPAVGVCPPGTKLKKIQTFNDTPAGIHPSSALKKQVGKISKLALEPRLEYLAFQELCMALNSSLQIKMVTAFSSATALLFTGPIRLSQEVMDDYHIVSEDEDANDSFEKSAANLWNESVLELDSWYSVKGEKQTLTQLLRIRHKFMHFFLHGIGEPTRFGSDTRHEDRKLLSMIRELLEAEHIRYHFARVDMPRMFLKNFESLAKKQVVKEKNHEKQQPVKVETTAQPFQSAETVQNLQLRATPSPINWPSADSPVFVPRSQTLPSHPGPAYYPHHNINNSFNHPPPLMAQPPVVHYNVAQPPPVNLWQYSAPNHPQMAGISARGGRRRHFDPRPQP